MSEDVQAIPTKPKRRKTQADTTINATGQTTHNVEQDGFGKDMHATIPFIPHIKSDSYHGIIQVTEWGTSDFSDMDTQPYLMNLTAMSFWFGTNPDFNNQIKLYQSLLPQCIGMLYHKFELQLTNQAVTRKRLLTQGTTSTVTHDFETSQNLIITYDNSQERSMDIAGNIIEYFIPFKTNLQQDTADNPFIYEELATGHTKTFTIYPPSPGPNKIWTKHTINEAGQGYEVNTKIPGRSNTISNTNSQVLTNQMMAPSNIYLTNYNTEPYGYPTVFLDQPHIKAETGIMKFIYRLKSTATIHYEAFFYPTNTNNKIYQRDVVALERWDMDITKDPIIVKWNNQPSSKLHFISS